MADTGGMAAAENAFKKKKISCWYSRLHYLLMFYNVFLWASGACLIACGTWYRLVQPAVVFLREANRFNNAVSYIFIVSGVTVIVAGIIGCGGTWRRSICITVIFFISLLLIFLAFVGASCYAVHLRELMKQEVKEAVAEGVDLYYTDVRKQKWMDRMQIRLNCCGASRGGSDYGQKSVPPTCEEGSFRTPCVDKMVSLNDLLIFGALVASFSIFMIAGMALAIAVCKAFSKTTF